MNSLNNWSIGKRLTAGFALTLLFSVLIGVLGMWRLNTVAAATKQMMRVPLEKERLISDWFTKIDSGIRRTTAIARATDPKLAAAFADEAQAAARESAMLQKKIGDLIEGSTESAIFDEIGVQRKRFLASRDEIARLKALGETEQAQHIFDSEFTPSTTQLSLSIRKLLQLQRENIDRTAKQIEDIELAGRGQIMFLSVVVIALGTICAWVLTAGIINPLKRAVEVARAVATGDLTVQIESTSTDETGQLLLALRDMNTSLVNIVSEVRAGSTSIALASNEIAAGNMDLSRRTEQQASALEETAATMEELTSTVKQNADHARHANDLARSASEVAVEGGGVVAKVVETMGAINDASHRISDIIGVIDGIAFQTNILALNAAVEAARAGEQGKGFAVVASEVRNLAHRSAEAAKEIKALIDDSVARVDAGSDLVAQAGKTMQAVVERTHRVTAIMSEIASASTEQRTGIEQINEAIAQMDSTTQQNASLVEQGAAGAQAMSEQAKRLNDIIATFKLGTTPSVTTGHRKPQLRLSAPASELVPRARIL